MTALATLLLTFAAIGLVLCAFQAYCLHRHLRGTRALPSRNEGISILKPLCGLDDGLEESLLQFTQLDHPNYELLLGVRSPADAAYPLAQRIAAAHPEKVRVILQRGAPGLNPKVNQLLTLERAARFNLLVISDSNVRVPAGYLAEIAGLLERAHVGLVTHPVSGVGERTAGALMDNVYLAATITPGVVTSQEVLSRPIVVGKSMALHRSTLAAIGGFATYKDVLAEDFLMGQAVQRIGKTVTLARLPIANVSEEKTLSAFFQRFMRWSTMQHKAVGTAQYGVIALQNPTAWAFLALLVEPSPAVFRLFVLTLLLRELLEVGTLRQLRRAPFPWEGLWALPVKDVLIFAAWCVGLVSNHVTWRGGRLRVGEGTRLFHAAPRAWSWQAVRRATGLSR